MQSTAGITFMPELSMRGASGPLARLMRAGALRSVFQPIVSLSDGSVHAHEALIRGPREMPLHSADALLTAARGEGLLLEFELTCVAVALQCWAKLRQPGRLFVNVSAAALMEAVKRRSIQAVVRDVGELGLLPRMLTFEITEHEHVSKVDEFIACVREVQATGITFALDDFGDGRSSLRLWSEMAPDTVKIDKYFTLDISRYARKLQTLRALMQIAEVFGTSLVAEGIESADDLRVIRDLGITWGQGYFLGRPDPSPIDVLRTEASDVLIDKRIAVLPVLKSASSPGRLRELNVIQADPIDADTSNDALVTLFHSHPGWPAVAVVDAGVPIGSDRAAPVSRSLRPQLLQGNLRSQAGTRLCEYAAASTRTRPRSTRIDRDPDFGRPALSDRRIHRDGEWPLPRHWHGRAVGPECHRVAGSKPARHANPLTLLPGNIPITEHIGRLLRGGADFAVCYLDLLNFKPFNDHYGYWRGDEMIKLVANTLLGQCDPQRDFIGHVGGDDFILLFQDDDRWEDCCSRIAAGFNVAARALYDVGDQAAGGIRAEDRHGVIRFFPITTLYVGAVWVTGGQFSHAEQVANAAARAKQEAKSTEVALVLHRGMQAESGFSAFPMS